MILQFSMPEIEQYGLQDIIPSDDDVEIMIQEAMHIPIRCGTNSISQVNPNAFCACSRTQIGSVDIACDVCLISPG